MIHEDIDGASRTYNISVVYSQPSSILAVFGGYLGFWLGLSIYSGVTQITGYVQKGILRRLRNSFNKASGFGASTNDAESSEHCMVAQNEQLLPRCRSWLRRSLSASWSGRGWQVSRESKKRNIAPLELPSNSGMRPNSGVAMALRWWAFVVEAGCPGTIENQRLSPSRHQQFTKSKTIRNGPVFVRSDPDNTLV
ncbi:hypothetical protein HPB47_024982 [Ixodes persulcatus]|uniref:Uncharacterized protein n=1 Tax=Ixodes persulcatus TaxID=34615 RepID=A0AC60Q2Y7_IXOPE|nr:hypothetical protein HPB47_024982 [Ixodes persulcatus]